MRTRRDEWRTILGISCDYHDAAAAIVVDGRIVAAVEEERLSRRKHDAGLPVHAVESCLAVAGLTADDVDVVAFYERPLAVMSRFVATRQREGPLGMGGFARNVPTLVGRNLMVGYRIERALRRAGRRRPVPLRYAEHHRSHAAAAFHPSPFDRAAILTVDGLGEWTTATIARGDGAQIEPLHELRFPDSLGLLYSLVTAWCGFEPNDGESKVMGLAPYGRPRFRDALETLAEARPDGSLAVDGRAVRWFSDRSLGNRRLHRLLEGPPRRSGQPIGDREADLAASIQDLAQDVLSRLAHHAHRLTGSDDLCLAGGVALNCVANGKLLRDGPFDRLWVQPAAGDSGSAIGAALDLWHGELGHDRTPVLPDAMGGAALGPSVTSVEVTAWAEAAGLDATVADDPDERCRAVADALADGAVVGWFQGRMEFGPRALGHRSILADPRSPDVRARINRSVKGREDFRPFAPAVLAERAAEWFDLDAPSPYMLVVADVRAEHRLDAGPEPDTIDDRASVPRSSIPACTHVDGSARVQTVDRSVAPEFHRLIRAFAERTGCPILLNTSFNVAGEPIVATPDHALDTARRGGLDLLVVENLLIRP